MTTESSESTVAKARSEKQLYFTKIFDANIYEPLLIERDQMS